MKILILASNPRKDLNLDREIRDLKQVIETSHNYQQFEVEDALAVRVGELQDLLFKYEPQIVHFCGHGGGQPGLIFEGNDGGEQWVRTDALRDLFRLFSDRVGCVLLNACYSEEQANEIVRHIDYVIGMNQEIRDDAAIAFSRGFYRALGYGCSIEEAYEFGCNAIQLEISGNSAVRSAGLNDARQAVVVDVVASTPIPEHLKPTLKKKQSILNTGQWRSTGKSLLTQSQKEELQWQLVREIAGTRSSTTPPLEMQAIDHFPASQPLVETPVTYSRSYRFRQILASSLLAGLLGVGGFYGYRQWQNYTLWQQEQPAQTTLHKAKEFAEQGLWEAAITTLNRIPPHSEAAKEIPDCLNAWSAPLLKQAKDLYDDGRLDEAISMAKVIPLHSLSHGDAQVFIGDWNKDKQTLETIKEILHKACDRPGGERLLLTLRSAGLQKQAKDLIAENEKKCPPPVVENPPVAPPPPEDRENPPPPPPPDVPDYQYEWLSQRIISPSELENVSDFELDIMRNSLFARHGMIFVDRPELQAVFEQQPWYKGVTTHKQSVYDIVTTIEWRNYEVIKQVQASRG